MERLLVVALVVAGAALSALVMGPAVSGLVIAMLLAYPLHRVTFARRVPRAEEFLPLYLGAIAWQLLHFFEEFATGFHSRLPELVGRDAWTADTFVAFNMVWYALFVVAAIAVLRRWRALTYFASFFVVAGLLNGVGHVALAAATGGYFPGLATAPVSFGFGLLLLRRLSPKPPEPPSSP